MNNKTYTTTAWRALNSTEQEAVLKTCNVIVTVKGKIVQIIMGFQLPEGMYGSGGYGK